MLLHPGLACRVGALAEHREHWNDGDSAGDGDVEREFAIGICDEVGDVGGLFEISWPFVNPSEAWFTAALVVESWVMSRQENTPGCACLSRSTIRPVSVRLLSMSSAAQVNRSATRRGRSNSAATCVVN